MHKLIVYGVSKQAFIPPTTELDFLKIDYAKNRELVRSTLSLGETLFAGDDSQCL